MERITRDSWNIIVENIIDIVNEYKSYWNENFVSENLEEYLTGEGLIEVMKEYRYGMRLRGFSPGCQPKRGFVEREDDQTGRYYDILVYDRKLTDKEVNSYELDYLGER